MTADHSQADSGQGTEGEDYARRLSELQTARWKEVLDVQRPYRWNLQRLHLGRCLDIGCGIGRNLPALDRGSVGVDHNPLSIEICRSRGFEAYLPHELTGAIGDKDAFDSLLMAHLLEHVDTDAGDGIFAQFLPYLRPGGRVVVITPQEWGFRSDPTHVRWVSHAEVFEHAERNGLQPSRKFSFPLPRLAGRLFIYNEFVTILERPQAEEAMG